MMRNHFAADTPEFIEGIHAFCDRWCTRCGMTAKCAMAMRDAAPFASAQTADASSGLFQFLQVQFQKSALLWDSRAAVCGTDASRPTGALRSHEHPLFLEAQRYASLVSEWFHAEEPWFDARHKALEVHQHAGLPNESFAEAMLEIRGAAETVGWYQFDIAAKLQHAVEATECPTADSRDSTRETVDGLAKAALVGIDRSIHAWLRLKRYRAELPDSVFALLVQLDRLRRAIDEMFPQARFFIRPGLDIAPTR